MARIHETDSLLLALDTALSEIAADQDRLQLPHTARLREGLESNLHKVVEGVPVVQLVYVSEAELSLASLRPFADLKLNVVDQGLSEHGFAGHQLPEPGIALRKEESTGETFRYVTFFRWLGNGVQDGVKLVGMERAVTKHDTAGNSTELGREIERLLFNANASEEDLHRLGYKPKTRSKFLEYRGY